MLQSPTPWPVSASTPHKSLDHNRSPGEAA